MTQASRKHHRRAHKPGCQTRKCDHWADRRYAMLHPQLGPVLSHIATFYSTGACDHGLGTLTASGAQVRFGIIASSYLPLGTHIRLTRPLFGRRRFTVLDTGAPFDVWLPCDESRAGRGRHGWGNPVLRFRIVG